MEIFFCDHENAIVQSVALSNKKLFECKFKISINACIKRKHKRKMTLNNKVLNIYKIQTKKTIMRIYMRQRNKRKTVLLKKQN
jgi:hypothetical protein